MRRTLNPRSRPDPLRMIIILEISPHRGVAKLFLRSNGNGLPDDAGSRA